MKTIKMVFVLIGILSICTTVFGAEVTLQWDANDEPGLAGYFVYYKPDACCEPYDGTGADQGNSPIKVPLGAAGFDPDNPEFTLTGLSEGSYYFVITAYDSEGNQSGYSNEIALRAPQITAPPSVTFISNDSAVIEWTTDEAGTSEVQYAKNPANWGTYDFTVLDENLIKSYFPEPHPERAEGAYSAQFEAGKKEYLILDDASASANMPWKNGTTNKTGTVWLKFYVLDNGDYQELFSKYDFSNNRRSFLVHTDAITKQLVVDIGYNNGDSYTSHTHDGIIEYETWYALGVSFEQNGGNNVDPEKVYIAVRNLKDGTVVGSDYAANAFSDPDNHEINMEGVPYMIGALFKNGQIAYPLNGYIDEFILSNERLTTSNFNAYANGTFNTSDSRVKCLLRFEDGINFYNDATVNDNDFKPGGSGAESNSHSVILTGLDSETVYYFRAGSTNSLGYGPDLIADDYNPSVEYSFTTKSAAEADKFPPQLLIPPYTSNVTHQSAVIGWGTDEPATGSIEYGLTTSYGQTISLEGQYQSDYSLLLTGLVGSTTYHFKVNLQDGAGNAVSSSDDTFTTSAVPDTTAPQFSSAPTITALAHDSFTVEWTTDENSDSQVQFGTTSLWWDKYPSKTIIAENVTRHKVTVTGLAAETSYYCRIGSTDTSGNGPTVSEEITLKTEKEPDTIAPQIITVPTVIAKTDTTVTIAWDTDEPGNSEIQYDTTANLFWGDYASQKNYADPVAYHAVTLTNLSENTTYYFRAGSVDGSGNGPQTDIQDNNPSAEIKFTTEAAADETAPQITSPPTVTARTHNSITVVWTTDEPSSSIVKYGESSGLWGEYPYRYFDPVGVTEHRVVITGLTIDTAYFLRVGGSDLSGNGPDTSPDDNNPSVEIQAKTEADFEPPRIVSPPTVTAVTNTGAVIEWSTDEPSNSLVQYGTATAAWDGYPSGKNDAEMVTHHRVALTNLAENTKYFCRIRSVDEFGNVSEPSLELVFKTDADPDTAAPVIVLPPTVTTATDTTVTIEWETDEPGNSEVQYRLLQQFEETDLVWNDDDPDKKNNVSSLATMVTRHRVTLTGLLPATLYQYQVGSTDALGNGPLTNLENNADEQNNPFTVDTFTTEQTKDEDAPKIIAGPLVSATDNRSAVIEWETDEPSNSIIKYNLEENALETAGGTTWENLPLVEGHADMRTQHTVTITNLNPSTENQPTVYIFRVGSTDALGNGPDLNQDPTNASVLGTFITAIGPDEAAPLISNIQILWVTNKTALITWETDEPGNSIVKYLDEVTAAELEDEITWESLALTESIAEMTRQHSVTVTDLQPLTRYLFQVGSVDASGNGPDLNARATNNPSETLDLLTVEGDDLTAPQIFGDVVVTSVTDRTAIIEWQTDEPGNSQVQYSNPLSESDFETGSNSWGNYPLSENDAQMVTNHVVTLTGLSPQSIYFFRVSSTDASGNNHAAATNDRNPSIEYNLVTTEADPPSIIVYGDPDYPDAYPRVDYGNQTIDITFDESNMNNAKGEDYYFFNPSLNFLNPGTSIVEISNGQGYNGYRLFFKSIPPYTILTLRLTEDIVDADGYAVFPDTILINDNDGDNLPDDWEVEYGLNPENGDPSLGEGKYGDFDGDGSSNYEEFLNRTDPKNFASFPGRRPSIVKTIPYYDTDLGTTRNVANNASFGVLVVDAGDGIDISNPNSVRITVNDGVNDAYEVNLANIETVRTIKLNANDPDAAVKALWVVYDRVMEETTALATYPFQAQVYFAVEVKNRDGNLIQEEFYYEIMSRWFHEVLLAPNNRAEVRVVDPQDPDINDPLYDYDTGLEVISGQLEHTKLIYNSEHPVEPLIIEEDENIDGVERYNIATFVSPPTIFSPPVKIIIPVYGVSKVDKVGVYVKEGYTWRLSCNNNCQPGEAGYGWMVPGSRVNRNNGNPSSIEIKAYHSAMFQPGTAIPDKPGEPIEDDDKADAKCFINTLINN